MELFDATEFIDDDPSEGDVTELQTSENPSGATPGNSNTTK